MNPSSSSSKRRPRETRLNAEALETRALLTGGVGDTFAIIPSAVTVKGAVTAVKFTVDPAHFTIPHGQVMMGFDVAAKTGSSVKPTIVSITSGSGARVPLTHSRYPAHLPNSTIPAGAVTTAVLAPVKFNAKSPAAPVTYTVNVKGASNTTGEFLVGFYLPGDANGDGKVDATDLAAIQAELGVNATSAKYTFDADANRDGRVNSTDVNVARKNLGAATTVSPTVTANISHTNETMANSRVYSTPFVSFSGTSTPGSTVNFVNSAAGSQAVTATADLKGSYAMTVPLNAGTNTFDVTTRDGFGQAIRGSLAPVTYSTTAPPASASMATYTALTDNSKAAAPAGKG